jgi:hypothetical protein
MTDDTLRDLFAACFMWIAFMLVAFERWSGPALMKVVGR